MPNNPSPLPEDVRLALGQGNKIEAIRLLRESTGLGLAEAKQAVEAGALPERGLTDAQVHDLSAEVTAALAQGKTVQAIKLLRESQGLSLQQAKAIAEAAAKKVRTPGTGAEAGLSPGQVRGSGVSLTMVVIVLAIAGALAWFVFGRT